MKKIGYITIFMLVFLVGCLGGGTKKTEKPDCSAGQTFDSVSRSCQGAVVTSQPPTPTLSALSLLEDSGTTNVILTYTDINSDLAFSCSVTSLDTNLYTALPLCICSGGVCSVNLTPDANFNGTADFSYTVQDNDGVSASQYVAVTVASINDKPTVANFSITVNEDTAIAAVNVGVSATVDDSQGGAPSENNIPLTYSVITPPSKHLTYSLTSAGILNYTPAANEEFLTNDQMVIRVSDSLGATEDITVTFTQGLIFDDNPIATTTAGTFLLTLTEDAAVTFSSAVSTSQLAFTEPDSSHFGLPDTYECVVNPDSVTGGDFFQTSACTCEVNSVNGAGTCTVSVLPKQNIDSSSNASAGPLVAYYVNDTTEVVTSNQQTFNVSMTDVNDAPVAYSEVGVTFAEAAGATHIAGAQALTISDAWDEVPASVTYTIVSGTASGTLSSCMDAGSAFTKTGCTYTPTSGNLQNTGTATAATWTLGAEISLAALTAGTAANSTTITMLGGFNIGNDPQIIVDPATDAISIYVDQAGTTAATDVTTAIAAHSIASKLITVTASPGNITTLGLMPRVDGTAGFADSFIYNASDGVGTSQNRTVYIDITPTNDNPVICHYSNYSDLNACGGLGCISDLNPDDLSIAPTTHTASKPLVFFNKAEGVCWKSTSVSNWELQSGSFIQDILVNEGEGTFSIDNIGIDEGGAGSEDTDTIGVTSIVSDNIILVPNGSVRAYFNNALQTVGVMPGSAFGGATSEGEGNFRLDITPQIGVTGTANITITTEDSSGASASYQFSFTVNGFSAIHNGWRNITAEGPRFNKFDQFLEDPAVVGDENVVCSYNVDKCNTGGECKGTSSPNAVVTADAANVLYYDSANNQCYKSTAAASNVWTALNTYCAVTPSYLIPDCEALGASCIGTADPNGTFTATNRNQFFFDETNSTCYRSTAATNSDWVVYNAAGEITIEWEAFDPIPAGEAISEYQIFRRLESDQFNYNSPINRNTVSAASTSFTDNAINSTYPPIPNTVYYYEVRPVIQGISTNTDEVFKLLRVFSPPDNTVFVHRWMVNNSICKLMNSTTIDPNNNYRCSYEGPGDSGGVPGGNFYDIGQDLIVDRFEAGCDYSGAPTCSGTADGSCIGINDPITDTSILASAIGDIYYSRSVGKCYAATGTGAGNWAEVDGTSTIAGYIKGHLPPLVNISQANSNTFCSNQSWSQVGSIGFAAPGAVAKALPTRKEQMAYSLWDTDNNTDSSITTIETGLSLNSSAKCNSSQANGFAATYSDVAVPDSNTFYSLPGTATSNIRSMMTGSNQTKTCVSRFGVQDHVGNVAEWTNERFNCLSACPFSRTGCNTASSQCTGAGNPGGAVTAEIGTYYLDGATCYINTDGSDTWSDVTLNVADSYGASFCEAQITGDTSALATTTTNMRYGDGTDQWFQKYLLDGAVGPCVDSNSDDACDGGIDFWALEDERNSAGRFIIPMGLPVVTDFNSNFPSSNILDFLFEIGPTSGITSTQLRDDVVNFDTATIAAEATGCGGMATGGSYLDGTGAGVYALELLPCTDSARSYITVGDITITQVGTGVTPSLEFINPGAANGAEIVSDNPATGLIQVTLRHDGTNVTSTPITVMRAINSDVTANTFAFAIVSGDASNTQSAAAQTSFTETNKKDAMIDVGFRCVAPVTGYSE